MHIEDIYKIKCFADSYSILYTTFGMCNYASTGIP